MDMENRFTTCSYSLLYFFSCPSNSQNIFPSAARGIAFLSCPWAPFPNAHFFHSLYLGSLEDILEGQSANSPQSVISCISSFMVTEYKFLQTAFHSGLCKPGHEIVFVHAERERECKSESTVLATSNLLFTQEVVYGIWRSHSNVITPKPR